MSTATMISPGTLQAYSRLLDAVMAPARHRRQPVARPAAAPAVRRPARSWLDRVDRWVDGWTDDRAELERYLARSQNIVDLENRMRDVLDTPPALRF